MLRPFLPHLRAALVLAHLVAITLLAIPAPLVSPKELKKPEVREAFEHIGGVLRSFGVQVTTQEAEDAIVPWARRYNAVRGAVLKPARRYEHWAGTHQGWEMFANVPADGARLVVERATGDGWERIYVPQSDTATWNRRFFEHERIRTLLNELAGGSRKADLPRLAHWLQPRLRADFPDAPAFRLSFEPVRYLPPAQLRKLGTIALGERKDETVIAGREAP